MQLNKWEWCLFTQDSGDERALAQSLLVIKFDKPERGLLGLWESLSRSKTLASIVNKRLSTVN